MAKVVPSTDSQIWWCSHPGSTGFERGPGEQQRLGRAGGPGESPGEAVGESVAQLEEGIQAFWRCQYHGTIAKNSSCYRVEPRA